MIRSITRKKSDEELMRLLKDSNRIFIAGCGTCTTLTHTGGLTEVGEMKEALTSSGKIVTGTSVIPVACDNISTEILVIFFSVSSVAKQFSVISRKSKIFLCRVFQISINSTIFFR